MLCVQGQAQFVKKTDSIIVGMDAVVVWQSGKQSHQETGNILATLRETGLQPSALCESLTVRSY